MPKNILLTECVYNTNTINFILNTYNTQDAVLAILTLSSKTTTKRN